MDFFDFRSTIIESSLKARVSIREGWLIPSSLLKTDNFKYYVYDDIPAIFFSFVIVLSGNIGEIAYVMSQEVHEFDESDCQWFVDQSAWYPSLEVCIYDPGETTLTRCALFDVTFYRLSCPAYEIVFSTNKVLTRRNWRATNRDTADSIVIVDTCAVTECYKVTRTY